ncbi:autophagy-related protein 11 isoform X2 [Neltuma alba]|uniref:autophagy-related protein 11 isoform X2 n=1 Tax=Neltuma alba TaxID=207710 RepID=UPI0010A53757|nr:autophagy-related protein 11-like isoform X2 [Prosopis alba]
MSSSVTGSFVLEGKLLVHIAENGRSFDLDCDETTVVEEIMRLIESLSGISFNDQIILYLDMKLESHRPLSAYKLPCDEGEVFIFNKARLQSNSLPPPPEQVDIADVVGPPLPSWSHNPHPLDDALDPALKALPLYERQFRKHFHCGHAIFRRSIMKYEHCKRLLREQMVQERAVQVASGNLDQYYQVINQNYGDFMKRYAQQHRMHSDLLVNFGSNVEKLKSTKLHPALQTPTCKCLMDFVKEENLRKSVDICTNSHKQFENKVSQFKHSFSVVKRRAEELLSVKASLSIKSLEQIIKEHQKYIDEQKSIMQSLSKDVNTVKKLVDDCLSCQLSVSLRPHDAVSALGPMYDVHDKNHLPRMHTCDHAISKLLDFCKERKNEMNTFLHNCMQNITYVSYLIKDQKLKFPVFKEAMTHQDNLFVDLKLFHGIGPTYRACLAEVVRRKASMKLYMGMAGQLAERLATKREFEVRRREEFLRAHSSYIPKGVLESMGLFDFPNQCDVNIAPFDGGLLNIDISDVDRYAPEYLVGVTSRLEKHGNFKVSCAFSTDSSHPIEAVDIASGSCTRNYSEPDDLLDGSELVEIAGTSRIEVENAKLKAELASRIALICSLCPEVGYESLDNDRVDGILKTAAEKTAEALQLKDEYIKHTETMLRMKQMQCVSYETRIQELEEKLSDLYLLSQKNSSVHDSAEFALRSGKKDDCKQGFVKGEAYMPCLSTTESMDETSCISSSLGAKLGPVAEHTGKAVDGADESMLDSPRLQKQQWDSPMVEPHHEEIQSGKKDRNNKMVGQLYMSVTNGSAAGSMPSSQDLEPCNSPVPLHSDSKVNGDYLFERQNSLADKTSQLNKTEMKLKSLVEEVAMLRRELEASRNLLDESQMNCAHLKNCLHEAREEALTQKSSADRMASEYSSLRSSVLRMRSLFERLKNCAYSLGGVAGFTDSLRPLAQSLAKHHEELLDKYPNIEATNERLRKELDEKMNQVKALYNKHQQEKQANKENVSFGHPEVHEVAVFVLNASGHYQAMTRDYSNYYLSTECVALFADHLPSRPSYIVGQIVHIEHQVVKAMPLTSTQPEHARADQLISDVGTDRLSSSSGSASNPYDLPIGCDYFVVTVAMLPDRTIPSLSSS